MGLDRRKRKSENLNFGKSRRGRRKVKKNVTDESMDIVSEPEESHAQKDVEEHHEVVENCMAGEEPEIEIVVTVMDESEENEDLGKEETDDNRGKRIVDVVYLFEQIRNYSCPRRNCTGTLKDTLISSFKDNGLVSTVYLRCMMCVDRSVATPVITGIQLNRNDERPTLNESMVLWNLLSGTGAYHAEQLFAYLGVKPMSSKFEIKVFHWTIFRTLSL